MEHQQVAVAVVVVLLGEGDFREAVRGAVHAEAFPEAFPVAGEVTEELEEVVVPVGVPVVAEVFEDRNIVYLWIKISFCRGFAGSQLERTSYLGR